ncbi:MAG: D-isomer specific 2-hydroxyacid dehydrogenase family protein [Candidatus Acetothermia bacterium]
MTRDNDNGTIAIVNSSSFGVHFPSYLDEIKEVGKVKRVTVNPGISGKDLADKLRGAEYVIASVTPDFPRSFFEESDDLKLIARHGIGCDNVDLAAATEYGVIVTRVSGGSERDAVAELTVALMMSCVRKVSRAGRAVETGRWDTRSDFVGIELSGTTVGVIGFGNIGSRVGEIARNGFNSDVLAYDPNIADPVIEKFGVESVSLVEILSRSDIISFNASLNPDNYHFIGKDEFAMMKDRVIIVNTARGELIEEDAFASALKSGKVAAAGVDVLEEEPLQDESPLTGIDNLIILPHVGSYTERSLREMDEKMVEDVKRVMSGVRPDEIVNGVVLNHSNRAGLE